VCPTSGRDPVTARMIGVAPTVVRTAARVVSEMIVLVASRPIGRPKNAMAVSVIDGTPVVARVAATMARLNVGMHRAAM
jgi:hypothetical protein